MDDKADTHYGRFEWNSSKAHSNLEKHSIDFYDATTAFCDPDRIIAVDEKHNKDEERFFCIGKIGRRVATVRFTYRRKRIRIIGAGYWRKGKKIYEEEVKKQKP